MANRNPIRPRVKDAVLRYIYDHKEDPPSNVAWQLKLKKLKASRAVVGDYLCALRNLESLLCDGPVPENEIYEKFGKYIHSRIRIWLGFLTQEGIYKAEGERENKTYTRIAEVQDGR